jgi:hypothetical protein
MKWNPRKIGSKSALISPPDILALTVVIRLFRVGLKKCTRAAKKVLDSPVDARKRKNTDEDEGNKRKQQKLSVVISWIVDCLLMIYSPPVTRATAARTLRPTRQCRK